MTEMLITPISRPLAATVRVPGSKSLTNRALLIAALSEGATSLENALFSDDSRYFANALTRLGFDIALDPDASRMTVAGLGGRIPATRGELFIGNAGTAARFLSAFLTLGHGEYILDGDARMRERPIGDLVEALTQLGGKSGGGQRSAVSKLSAGQDHRSRFTGRQDQSRRQYFQPIFIRASHGRPLRPSPGRRSKSPPNSTPSPTWT